MPTNQSDAATDLKQWNFPTSANLHWHIVLPFILIATSTDTRIQIEYCPKKSHVAKVVDAKRL